MDLETRQQAQSVRCEDTNKLLARMSEQGLYLYCKECRCEHLVSWKNIQRTLGHNPIHANAR